MCFRAKRSQVVFDRKTKKIIYCWCLVKPRTLPYLAQISDIINNELNKKLQDSGINLIVHTDAIKALVAKLKLLSQGKNNRNFALFHRLNDITGDNLNTF